MSKNVEKNGTLINNNH